MVASPRDAGDSRTAARRVAAPHRARALPGRRPRLRLAALARRGGPARDRPPARHAGPTRGLDAPRAARGARRLAGALDLLVSAARPLVGLREPRARLPA